MGDWKGSTLRAFYVKDKKHGGDGEGGDAVVKVIEHWHAN